MHEDHVHMPWLYFEFYQILPPTDYYYSHSIFPYSRPVDPEKPHLINTGTINTQRAYRTSSITICEKITSR
jgi:hypothetical protein